MLSFKTIDDNQVKVYSNPTSGIVNFSETTDFITSDLLKS